MENQENVEQYYQNARRKAKTNMVWFGIFSIVMLFAGLTSGYIVSKGDNFWVSFNLPTMMWVSTLIILVSSVTMILAVKASKSGNKKQTTSYLLITLLLGIAFGISQFFAWGDLHAKGYSLADKIIHPETGEFLIQGEYGTDFEIEFQGKKLIQEEDGFYFWGEQAMKIDKEEYTNLENNSPELFVGKKFIRVQENKRKKDKVVLEAIVESKMKLPESYLAKLQTVGNVSSSYFYALTVVHLLHIFVALFYLLGMVFLATKKELNEDNQLKIKLGGYFWHFFAGLWLYLLLFLFLIH